MTDLVERLRAALDAEEARLHALPPFPWKLNPDDDTEVYAADDVVVAWAWALSTSQQQRVALHILAGSPEHGLRMVAAHRQILDLHAPHGGAYAPYARACSGCGLSPEEEPRVLDINQCPTLTALAEAYGVEV